MNEKQELNSSGDLIKELENWYFSQCNKYWEDDFGIKIGTLDNPGWFLKIDLVDTNLEGKEYQDFSYGVGDEAETSGNNWVSTKLENGKFVAHGGPQKLHELIKLFITWAKK